MVQSKTKIAGKTHRVSSRVKKQKVSEPLTKKKAIKAVVKPESNPIVLSESHELSIVEMAQRIVETGSIKGNEFSRMRYETARRIIEYDRIRKECDIQDEGLSKTIFRMAKPFIEGCFTIAIVGKTSAGKSTFINTLIGENLFPTGKNQTTSTLTFIENGSEANLKVLFCDGHTECVGNDIVKIKEKLKGLVSVSEEYSKLPVNQINHLISEDYDLKGILEQKANIEKKAKKPEVDEELWRRYINSHTKKDIPQKVMVLFPLPIEFDGWRIIDTPGVGATGGIQEVTKTLFNERDEDNNKIVDAIVYLQDGSCYMEDETVHDFMEKVYNGLTEEAKHRLFFVLTQATREQSIGSDHFILEKNKTLQKARELYSDTFGIPQDRFVYIDSLLERFNNEVKDKVDFDMLPCPSNWDVDEWNFMTNLYSPIKKQIKRSGLETCSESFVKIMKEWSDFDCLKSLLNEFVRKEKSDVYDKIAANIKEDLDSFIKRFRKDMDLLTKGKEEFEKEKRIVVEQKNDLNDKINDLQEKVRTDYSQKFNVVDSKIDKFDNKEDIDSVFTLYFDIYDALVEIKKGILNEIKQEYKDYWDDFDKDGRYGLIDFDDIEKKEQERKLDESLKKAKDKNTKHILGDPKYTFVRFQEFLHNLFEKGKLIFRKTTYPDEHDELNKEQMCRDFAEDAKNKALSLKKHYFKETEDEIDSFTKSIGVKMEEKINGWKTTLNECEQKIGSKDVELKKLAERIKIIEKTMNRNGEAYGK